MRMTRIMKTLRTTFSRFSWPVELCEDTTPSKQPTADRAVLDGRRYAFLPHGSFLRLPVGFPQNG